MPRVTESERAPIFSATIRASECRKEQLSYLDAPILITSTPSVSFWTSIRGLNYCSNCSSSILKKLSTIWIESVFATQERKLTAARQNLSGTQSGVHQDCIVPPIRFVLFSDDFFMLPCLAEVMTLCRNQCGAITDGYGKGPLSWPVLTRSWLWNSGSNEGATLLYGAMQ